MKIPEDFKAICAIVNSDLSLQSLLYDANLLPEQTMESPAWRQTMLIARHWVASFGTPKPVDGAFLTDEWIDSVCAPNRAKRWHGDGRQYDRDTARLLFAAALQIQHGLAPDAKPPRLDPMGMPMLPATLLERTAVYLLNGVKAWRDSDGNEPFPHDIREGIDALLMMAEVRRTGLSTSDPEGHQQAVADHQAEQAGKRAADSKTAYAAWLAKGQNSELDRFAVTRVAFGAGFEAALQTLEGKR
jgi:hypothetical protein